MLNHWKYWKKKISGSPLMAWLIKGLLYFILITCRIRVNGVKYFCDLARKEKCVLMLWHNRLAIIPFVLSRHTPKFVYTALVSASRDGEFLSGLIHSYKNGRTIRASHLGRHAALRECVRTICAKKEILVITPDGPRGPLYKVKPGVALTALETEAFVFPLTWEASRYWQLKTWDGLRLPRPFSTIEVNFDAPIQFKKEHAFPLEEATCILQNSLSQ